MKNLHYCIITAVIIIAIVLFVLSRRTKEGYRDPIYVPREKLALDWYPKARGSIYGNCAHAFSGHTLYPTAI